MVAGVLTPEL